MIAKTYNFNKMKNKTIEVRDPVVGRVVDKFLNRSNIGFKKYGSTLHDERTKGLKDLSGYLNDVQEELMDAILYIQAAREEMQDMSEELLLKNINVYEEEIL